MHVFKVIFIVLEVLILFNLLIFVHELGHFLAARWRGLKVERFAIWFGKPIWKKSFNGVEYCLGCIPAGGYVSLPQMATMEAIEGKTDEKAEQLPNISPLDKIIVAFAGPLFSFLLALVFAVVVMIVGRPVSESETTTTVGSVEKGGPAAEAGLLPGDKILKVADRTVTKFGGMGDSIAWRVVSSEGTNITLDILRDGKEMKLIAPSRIEKTEAWERKGLRQISIEPAQSSIVAKIYTNSPAAAAGLKPGDEIVTVNGQKIFHYGTIADLTEKNGTQPITLAVLRGTNALTLSVTPEIPLAPTNERPRLGILWLHGGKTALSHPGAIEQVRGSLNAMISTFGALFSSKTDIKPQHLGGAIKIISVYYLLFESENGWRLALWFSVLMNVNLALLNMLPFPVLDGGHITLAIFEKLFRRPVSAKLLGYIQSGCAVVLIGFMLYIAFYDVQELPWKQKQQELTFAPKPVPAK